MDLTSLIPIRGQFIEMALIFLVIAPISALLGGLVGGYLLAPLFLFIHKNILRSKFLYGIQERSQPTTFRDIFRGYYPALLALNLCSIIVFSVPWVLDLILGKEAAGLTGATLYIAGIIVLLMFTIGLSMIIFSPIWFLNDAGIVYSNKEEVAETGQPVEVRTVGGRFIDFLRGYAGIGVVLSYAQLVLAYFNELGAIPYPSDVIALLGFFFGFPIFMLIASIPSLIVLDMIRERRIRFVRTVAGKMGITDFVEISFEKVNR